MHPDTPRTRPPAAPRHDEVVDALGAYALDALDPEERAAVETHVAGCPTCQVAIARYDTALGAFAATAPPLPPPPALRARLLDDIASSPPHADQPVASDVAPPSAPPPSPLPAGIVALPRAAAIGLALVASLLLAAVVAGSVLLVQTRADLDEARDDQETLSAYLRDLGGYLRNGGTVTPMTAVDAGAGPTTGRGSLFVAPAQDGGMIVVYGLPPVDDDHEYRVWVARGADRTRVDRLWVTDDGFGWLVVESPEPLTTYDTLGITLAAPDDDQRQDLLVAAIPQPASG